MHLRLRSARAAFSLLALSLLLCWYAAAPALVQAQGTSPQKTESQTPSAQSSPTIRSIQVIDVKELPPAVLRFKQRNG